MSDHELVSAVASDDPASATAPGHNPRDYLSDEPEVFRLPRDDARDLRFTGWLLGRGETGAPPLYERCITVSIYVTRAGDYVVHEERIRGWGAVEKNAVKVIPRTAPVGDVPSTGSSETPRDRSPERRLLDALRMGSATRDAWNEACKKYPPLAPLATETIE
jgi:hypothetical protein